MTNHAASGLELEATNHCLHIFRDYGQGLTLPCQH